MDSFNNPWIFKILRNNYDEPIPYYFTSTILLLLVAVLSAVHFSGKRSPEVPIFGQHGHDKSAGQKRWMTDCLNLLQEGYRKFQDRPFQVWTTEGYQVILPPKLVDETKMLPDASFTTSLPDILQSKHTTFGDNVPPNWLSGVLKHDLNKSIPKLFDGMREELQVGLVAELPPCHDWTPIALYSKVTRVIARMSGRSFVGPSLNRNEEWITINVDYTRDVFQGAVHIRGWKPFLRPMGKYFVPEVRRIWDHNAKAVKLIDPILKQRVLDERKESYEKPVDAVQWFRDTLPEEKKDDVYLIALQILALGAASIHTTSQMITNVLFDLAARPDYIELLREEVSAVLESSGGRWNQEVLAKLKKMDSFMKESQRTTAAMVSYTRRAVKDMTLSDGTHIPKGTYLLAPARAISADADSYTDPDIFEGLRYYNMRERSAADENKHQFTSTSKSMLHFGTGRHACPGRWFASTQIKLVVATLLLKYDFKFKEGQGRPQSIHVQGQAYPNPFMEVLFKKREH